MRRVVLLVFIFIGSMVGGTARGQIVLPGGTPQTVSLVRLNELVIYHKQREELIIQAVLDWPAGEHDASRLAFVIPVPAAPESVKFEDSSVLDDMISYERREPNAPQRPPEAPGDYKLTYPAITAEEDEPVSESLNRWLALNGLATIDAAKLKYYDDNGWSFVVERVWGGEHHGIGALKPVRISFGATRITFPVRMMASSRPFSCSLFLITKNNLDVTPLEDYGFSISEGASRKKLKHLPESLESIVSKAAANRSLFKELKRGHIYMFSAAGDVHQPDWSGEVLLPGPHASPFEIVQNVLAVAAAALAVIIMTRPRKKGV